MHLKSAQSEMILKNVPVNLYRVLIIRANDLSLNVSTEDNVQRMRVEERSLRASSCTEMGLENLMLNPAPRPAIKSID